MKASFQGACIDAATDPYLLMVVSFLQSVCVASLTGDLLLLIVTKSVCVYMHIMLFTIFLFEGICKNKLLLFEVFVGK